MGFKYTQSLRTLKIDQMDSSAVYMHLPLLHESGHVL
jgi:hypothetical protein